MERWKEKVEKKRKRLDGDTGSTKPGIPTYIPTYRYLRLTLPGRGEPKKNVSDNPPLKLK
jgi:hypothetical protein